MKPAAKMLAGFFGYVVGSFVCIAAGALLLGNALNVAAADSYKKLLEHGDLIGGLFTFGAAVVAWQAIREEAVQKERTAALQAIGLAHEMLLEVNTIKESIPISWMYGVPMHVVSMDWRTDGRMKIVLEGGDEVSRAMVFADTEFARWQFFLDGKLGRIPDGPNHDAMLKAKAEEIAAAIGGYAEELSRAGKAFWPD